MTDNDDPKVRIKVSDHASMNAMVEFMTEAAVMERELWATRVLAVVLMCLYLVERFA